MRRSIVAAAAGLALCATDAAADDVAGSDGVMFGAGFDETVADLSARPGFRVVEAQEGGAPLIVYRQKRRDLWREVHVYFENGAVETISSFLLHDEAAISAMECLSAISAEIDFVTRSAGQPRAVKEIFDLGPEVLAVWEFDRTHVTVSGWWDRESRDCRPVETTFWSEPFDPDLWSVFFEE